MFPAAWKWVQKKLEENNLLKEIGCLATPALDLSQLSQGSRLHKNQKFCLLTFFDFYVPKTSSVSDS